MNENDLDDDMLDEDLMDDDDMDDTTLNNFEELAAEEVATPEPEKVVEPEQEPEHETEKHKPSHENVVPQARLNKEIIKSKQKDETIADLQKQLAEQQAKASEALTRVPQPGELQELYKQLKNAYFEDDDSAQEIQDKITRFNQALAEELIERKLAEREQSRLENEIDKMQRSDEQMMSSTIAEWIDDHPELDQNSDQFDIELWNDTMIYQKALVENKGMTGNEALEKALAKFVGLGPVTTDTTPVKKTIDKRTERSVTRGIEASRNTAPNINKDTTGNRSKPLELDFANMSEAEFNKLPQDVIDRAKGKK